MVERWHAEGIDLMETVKAIVSGKAPLQSVQWDMAFLNRQATSYKSAMSIPGVKALSKKSMSGRS